MSRSKMEEAQEISDLAKSTTLGYLLLFLTYTQVKQIFGQKEDFFF